MDLDDVRLGIALPHNQAKPLSFSFFLTFTIMEKPRSYVLLVPKLEIDGSYEAVASARNELVKQAIEEDCTHILFMDTDQTYPTNTFTKLLSHNLPFVAAKVHRRYVSFDPILLRMDPEYNDINELLPVPEEEWKNNELIKVDATGGGCSLIETSVFFDLKYPWYRTVRENPKYNRKRVGEDIFFCLKRLRPAGYEVWVDTKLDIGHEAKLNINENFYDLTKGMTSYRQIRLDEK